MGVLAVAAVLAVVVVVAMVAIVVLVACHSCCNRNGMMSYYSLYLLCSNTDFTWTYPPCLKQYTVCFIFHLVILWNRL